MTLSALRSVGDAIDATREFLLPTSLGKWAKLSLLAIFLGAPGTPIPANPQFADPTFWRGPPRPVEPGDDPDAGAGPGSGDGTGAAGDPGTWPGTDVPLGFDESVLSELLAFDALDPGTWPDWLLAAVLVATAIALLYAYVGVLSRFVVVEALRADAVAVRSQARPHLRGALSVLAVRLVLALVVAVPAVLALVLAIAPAGEGGVDGLGAVALGAAAAGLGFLVWLLDTITLQFVVPTMIAEDAGVLGAWRRFARTLRSAWGEYAAFAVVRFVVGTAVGIAATIGVAVAVVLALLVLGTIGAVVVVLAGGLGSLGTAAVATLLALLAVLVAYAIAAAAAIAMPFQVYLWTYALLVLGDTDAELDLIPDLRAAAREGDGLAAA